MDKHLCSRSCLPLLLLRHFLLENNKVKPLGRYPCLVNLSNHVTVRGVFFLEPASKVITASATDPFCLLKIGKVTYGFYRNSYGKPNGAGEIRTLAPITRPTPLAGVSLQPLGYDS